VPVAVVVALAAPAAASADGSSITIANGASTVPCSSQTGICTPTGPGENLSPSALLTALQSGSVTVEAGDITVDDDVICS
jgi:hypothetical protein